MRWITTTYRPDTCECELSYAWDADVPAEDRVHIPVMALPCSAHDSLVPDAVTLMDLPATPTLPRFRDPPAEPAAPASPFDVLALVERRGHRKRVAEWRDEHAAFLASDEYQQAQAAVAEVLQQRRVHFQAHYDQVVDAENRRKNRALKALIDALPEHVDTVIDAEGNSNKSLRDGVVSWSFDADRILHIHVKASGARAKAQAALTREFGNVVKVD